MVNQYKPIDNYKEAGFDELMQRKTVNNPAVPKDSLVSQDKQIFQTRDDFNFRIVDRKYAVIPKSAPFEVQTIIIPLKLGYIPTCFAFARSAGLPTGWNLLNYMINDGAASPFVNFGINEQELSFTKTMVQIVEIYYLLFREAAK